MKNRIYNYIVSFVAVLISISLGTLTGIDEVRNGIILSFIFHWLLFIPAFIFKTEKFYDLTGSLSYITIILYVLISSNNGINNFGNVILSSLIIIWTLRLGSFLFFRIKKAGEDKRFREINKSFSWFTSGLSTENYPKEKKMIFIYMIIISTYQKNHMDVLLKCFKFN